MLLLRPHLGVTVALCAPFTSPVLLLLLLLLLLLCCCCCCCHCSAEACTGTRRFKELHCSSGPFLLLLLFIPLPHSLLPPRLSPHLSLLLLFSAAQVGGSERRPAVLRRQMCAFLVMMSYNRSMVSFVPPCSNLEKYLGPSVTSQPRASLHTLPGPSSLSSPSSTRSKSMTHMMMPLMLNPKALG